MSNIHGLDFLRREHVLNEAGTAKPSLPVPGIERSTSWVGPDVETLVAQVAHKPDLEKQFDVIHFLQAHRSSGCLAPSVIYQRTGIDLQEDEAVAEMLQHNPKIRVELVPDPENPSLMIATYAYQAKYNHVRDRTTLLAQINRCKNGVPRRDLEDAYDGVEVDLDILITAGDVLAIHNSEDKTQIIFPRGEAFLVELDGIVSIPKPKPVEAPPIEPPTEAIKQEGDKVTAAAPEVKSEPLVPTSNGTTPTTENGTANESMPPPPAKPEKVAVVTVDVDVDPRSQIRRGEAIQVGGQWFRVSSAVKEGPLKDQPARAHAPLSVVSLRQLSKRNEQDGYIRPFDDKKISTDHDLKETSIRNIQRAGQARERLLKLAHGRSGGVASQLLGSYAHASNPKTLAASFGAASLTGSRKRPHKGSGRDTHKEQQTQKENAAQAKEAAADPFLSLYTHARRHGCTRDVREMYLATRADVPSSDVELHRLLVENKLLEPGEQMRRARLKRKANVDNDGKPKKRRYYERKNQRMTNTHLEGTEIGAILRRAQEKQKQGEQVGDGGM